MAQYGQGGYGGGQEGYGQGGYGGGGNAHDCHVKNAVLDCLMKTDK